MAFGTCHWERRRPGRCSIVLKNAPEGRHGVRQLAAALACLPDISCIFEGASKLAHSTGSALDKNYAALTGSAGVLAGIRK
jgi:hypothetical protein